ncbi:lantibiotic dehydratase C-terminal domain-containing protein [Spirosoma montaniterrae]|uniref:Thiopeptide-type bacteriocin biosynthesis domain-containing protein n=1 Tax=Spirosoma montaniterrae TaxID=1178516 RepID=A0A1P9WW04_9BACT|nr:lantibiotic dehydratase C-terminal domain-containing protein [Spirosoma montaniterrae]AQG79575.1 hypothetical protein AWR27_09705 [Spirosoma montaniterrae]
MNRAVTSIHIYYRGHQDALLLDYVLPILVNWQKNGRISQYAFLRYWNGGDHLRLRLFACTDEADALAQLANSFSEHLRYHPHVAQPVHDYNAYANNMRALYDKLGAVEVENIEPLRPEPGIELHPYRFEKHRYGTDEAQALSEDHFAFSSVFAGRLLKLTRDNLPARITLLMHLSMMMVGVIDDQPGAIADLFHRASQTGLLLKNHPDDSVEDTYVSRGFPTFDEQIADLEPVLTQLQYWLSGSDMSALMHVPGQSPAVQAFLHQWQVELRKRWVSLQQLDQRQLLPINPSAILMTYLHLLFNRLDIAFSLECYTYYLTAKAINHLTELNHVIR